MTFERSRRIGLIKRLRRFQHIINVFTKLGFGEVFKQIRIWENTNLGRRFFNQQEEYKPELTIAQRLRMALEELGPTFIKLGQVLSTRPDLLPPDIIAELKKLQISALFVPSEVIKEILESELGKPVEDIFERFDDEPIAAASLAQVHRARYKGEEVAVKVRRPNITEITEEDLSILRTIAGLTEKYSENAYLINPIGLVEEFSEQIRKELDFLTELKNLRRFASHFTHDDTVYIPFVYPRLSSRRVLTMEYLDGIHVSNISGLLENGYDLSIIAKNGAKIGFEATFKHGFFHADPHPGNIIILPGNVIGMIDFGMMAVISERDRERLAKLVSYISLRDDKRVARALVQLSETEEFLPAEDLEPAMAAIIREYSDVQVSEFRLGQMLFAMIRILLKNGARLRPQLLWLAKSMVTQEDIGHTLKADFNYLDMGREYAQSSLSSTMNPFTKPKELYYWLVDLFDMVKDLPYDINVIVREIRKGKIRIEFQHAGLEPIVSTINRSTNRLSLTVLTAAFLISAAVVTLARVSPTIGELSLIAIILYSLAGVTSIILLFIILFRSK